MVTGLWSHAASRVLPSSASLCCHGRRVEPVTSATDCHVSSSPRARRSLRISCEAPAPPTPSPSRQTPGQRGTELNAAIVGIPFTEDDMAEGPVPATSAKARAPGQRPGATIVQRRLAQVEAAHRSVPITVHGCISVEDATWLKQEVEKIPGVKSVFVQGVKEGGLRGGLAQLQLEVAPHVRLPQIVDAVHAVEDRLLALPFKAHSWLWKGHKINYAVAGCGRPVILVHGFGGSAGHFRNLIAHLADDHRVYAVDLLGFGDSDKPADVDYGPELWADIINDFAAEFAEEPPVLIGNSIGSLTALTAAAQAAKKSNNVRGLVLLNVAGAMNRKGLMQDDLLLHALSPIFIAIEFLLMRPAVASFLFQRFKNRANIRKILAEQVYKNSAQVDDRLLDILMKPSLDHGAVDVFVRVFTGEPGPRPEALVGTLGDVPMLVLWGDADPWTPINGKVADIFRQLELQGRNVKVLPLAGVGHCPHDDQPELAASHILPWLESLDSSEL